MWSMSGAGHRPSWTICWPEASRTSRWRTSRPRRSPTPGRASAAARAVNWVVGDAATALFDEDSVDLWHDRAVFHFLIDPARRDAYLEAVRRCVRPGGFALIATFGPNGPECCSGLPVTRHASSGIAAALGSGFELVERADEEHTTPSGASQAFAYALCRRSAV